MRKPNLSQWFYGVLHSNLSEVKVPSHICELPCGCKRKPKDKQFVLRLTSLAETFLTENDTWVHHGPACGKVVQIIPISAKSLTNP